MKIRLTLSDLAFDVRAEGALDETHVRARFGAYETPADAPPSRASPIALTLRVDPDWKLPREPSVAYPGVEVTREGDTIHYLRAHDELRWNPSTRQAEGTALPPLAGLRAVEDPTALDTPLRLLVSYELLCGDGLLLHASGYGDGRGAVLFLAVSGGGKTTTARKLPHEGVLSDDQVALTRSPEGWTAHALPFVGEYARATRPLQAPLRALVLLEKASEVSLRRVSAPVALARVARCVVHFVPGAIPAERLLARIADLTEKTPVYALALTREAPVEPHLAGLLGS